LASEPLTTAANAQFAGLSDLSFSKLRLFAGQTTGGNPYAEFVLDEIRIGTTYADVAPIAGPPALDTSFDADTDTDGDDLLIWQRNLGIMTGATNAQGDTDVDAGDLQNWRDRYGMLTSTPAAAPVPEPAGFGLAVIALFGLAAKRRRRA
jgi:MYXO-CTERM domain-containing protein